MEARQKPTAAAKNPAWSDLSLPARDLIAMEPYRAAWIKAHGYFSTNMVSSRGCPTAAIGVQNRFPATSSICGSASAVAEEMRLLKVSAGVQHIWFGDDVFALDRHWVQRFAEEVVKRDATVPFKIQSRADLMSETTVKHLKAAGVPKCGWESNQGRKSCSMRWTRV